MVALLVLFMILGCLLADAILLSVRERRAVKAGEWSTTPAHAMVFAQDGGKPVEQLKEQGRQIPWEDIGRGKDEPECNDG